MEKDKAAMEVMVEEVQKGKKIKDTEMKEDSNSKDEAESGNEASDAEMQEDKEWLPNRF